MKVTCSHISSLLIIIVSMLVLTLGGCGGGGGGGGDAAPASLTISGQVLAPGGQVAAKSGGDLFDTFAHVLVPRVEASVTGLVPVPDGTVVDLVLINDAGTIETLLESTETTNGRYSFNLTELGVAISNDLVVMVVDLGTQMRAFVTGSAVDIEPVSEATVQMVFAQIAAVPGTLLENFTVDELADLYASVDFLTSLEGLASQPGIDPTVQAIKDLVTQEDGIVQYLLAASESGQTEMGPGDVGNLFPLAVENTWEYLVSSSDQPENYYNTSIVTGTKAINGITAYILTEINPDGEGNTYDEYLEKNSMGIINWGNTDPEDFLTPEVVPYQQEYFPVFIGRLDEIMSYKGLVWREDLDGDGLFETFDVTATIATVGFDEVTVPVGVFDGAVKQEIEIVVVVRLSRIDEKVTVKDISTQWLAKDIGIIRAESIFTVEGLGQTDTSSAVMELVDYLVDGNAAYEKIDAASSGWTLSGFGSSEVYRGQTFTTLDSPMTAEQLIVFVGPTTDDNADFRVLLTEIVLTNDGFNPTTVLYESETLNVPVFPIRNTPDEYILYLGGIRLEPNRQYAWMLDHFVVASGEVVSMSTALANPYEGGASFRFHNGPFLPDGTREDHFADSTWTLDAANDFAFTLKLKPIDNP
jgi:hypothetical protein